MKYRGSQRRTNDGYAALIRLRMLLRGTASLVLAVILIADIQRTFVKLVAYLGAYWILWGMLDLGVLYPKRFMSGWQVAAALLSIAAGAAIVGLALRVGSRIQDVLVLVAGGFGVVIGVLGIISGLRGGSWADWTPGVLNALFGLILVCLYVLAPPLVVVSIVACAIIGGLVELTLALRGKLA
jgi:uncharacterized membrane protein HdeD (DUF308 family)